MSEKQSRIFTGILYPDATNYDFEKVITRLGDRGACLPQMDSGSVMSRYERRIF